MKRSLLPYALFVLSISASPVTEEFRARVEMIETGGRNVRGKDGEVGVMQMTSRAWADVNQVRKSYGLPQYPFSRAWDPPTNRAYGFSFLEIQRGRLKKHLRREPSREEIYSAYRRGFTGFKRFQRKT